ncbi:hypothetical protein CGCS363_v000977 [Colletotrichum siamense]|uniref:uncharacterized protein n=1 Tax=Colletotrichum siamense TaxID=690259 RepID=UPI0018729344|nr:uncharacterized protein CGCS363_v000977 [Colletotrichum siamense]KAF5515623.1 hypothetical protein CGCS363_v000977 [Colletotrichum siamense]
MCYKKQTYYKSCSHTRTEEEDCPHQKRLSQLRLQERLDAHRRQRSSWLLCIFCFLIAPEPRPRTPEPRRECPLQDVRVEIDGRCPQCRLLDAQAAAVGRRDRYEYDYAARRCRVRGEVEVSQMNAVADLVSAQVVDIAVPMDEAERREGTRGRAGWREHDARIREPERTYMAYRPEGRRNTDASAGSRRPNRGRDFVPYRDPVSSGLPELPQTPQVSSPESTSYAWPAPLRVSKTKGQIRSPDWTSSACPAPLRISKTKQNQDPSRPTQTQHVKSPNSTSSGRPAPLRVSKTKQNQDVSKPKRNNSRKPGRSAVGTLENPPLSAVMEDVEKAWNDACPDGGSAARTARKPSQEVPQLTSPSSYSPELPIDDLIDEVELLWRRAACNNDGPR